MSDSIREALTAAVAKHEAPADNTSAAPVAADDTISNPDPVDSAQQPADTADEGSGPSEGAAGGESIPVKDSAPVAATPAAPETPAPASWSNEERAAWATVPKPARDAILRRESEMNRALQVSAGARRRVEAIDRMAETYKPLLDRYGVTVEQAMPGLLATRAVLEVGTPEQKAQMVASICADFGVELEALNDALVARWQNGPPAARIGAPQPDINSLVDQRLNEHPLIVQYRAAQTERARAAVATVQTQPHFEAVRHTMADLIDQAKAFGRELAVDGAYRLACELHGLAAPAAPAAAQSVSDAARTLAAARNAAASVSGAPKPTPARKPGEGSLREELEANLAAATSRRR